MSESKGKEIPNSDLKEASKGNEKALDASSFKEDSKHKEYPITVEDTFEKSDKSQELELKNQINSTPINNLNTPQEIAIFAEVLVKAKMCPFKEPADATIALIAGKELGLSLAATLQGIHPIEGRPSLGVHIKKGILLQNNVLFRRVRDMEDYFEYVDFNIEDKKKHDEREKIKPPEKRKGYKPELIGYGYLDDLEKFTNLAKYEVRKRKIDIRTEYLFTRYFNTHKGVVKNTAKGIFSYSEAQTAGLLEKNNWKNYLRDMLASRAFSRGANEIADDLLHGLYSFSELADINDSVTYYIDENGHEQIIK